MDHIVNRHEAKSQLSKLVALAQQGESVTIAILGKPVVKRTPTQNDHFTIRTQWIAS